MISLTNTEGWHTQNFTVNLTPEPNNLGEIFYSINGGSTQNVTGNGEPVINSEGANNTLEYWSTWITPTGTVGLPHTTVTSIQLDKTPPTGSITTSSTAVNSAKITLYFSLPTMAFQVWDR